MVAVVDKYTEAPTELGDLITNSPKNLPESIPQVDVLVPAYKDGNVVHQAISSLRDTRYPDSKLNINILVEPDDEDTQEALTRIGRNYNFNTIMIPEAYPLSPNKPRALDYGFNTTSGDIVGVIDAEDVVDRDLFRYVVTALCHRDNAFVQGKLDMINEKDGWKNLLFRGEYGYWYNLFLKGFFTVGYPVPLGGTTNFFHRETLNGISQIREDEYGSPWPDNSTEWFETHSVSNAAPWDPLNVTENFELGLLLWLHNFEMGYMDVTTHEESPIDYTNWITQRTRWEKGKIYTMFQWFRHPPEGIRNKFHLIFQSFIPHYAAINVTGIVILFMYSNLHNVRLVNKVQLLLLVTLSIDVLQAATHAYAYVSVSDYPVKLKRILRASAVGLTLPVYWVLHWGATLRAMYQIYTRNLNWEKTDHHGRNKKKKKKNNSESTTEVCE